MSDNAPGSDATAVRCQSSYGWVIVAAVTLMIALTYGILYSYGVFLKPLADHFGWGSGDSLADLFSFISDPGSGVYRSGLVI